MQLRSAVERAWEAQRLNRRVYEPWDAERCAFHAAAFKQAAARVVRAGHCVAWLQERITDACHRGACHAAGHGLAERADESKAHARFSQVRAADAPE